MKRKLIFLLMTLIIISLYSWVLYNRRICDKNQSNCSMGKPLEKNDPGDTEESIGISPFNLFLIKY